VSPPVPSRRTRVVFRYDDCSSFSPLALEEKLIEAFRARGLSCAFGIVPLAAENQLDPLGSDRRPLSGDKVELLQEAVSGGTVEAVLHGCTHRAFPRTPREHPSEFAGLGRDRQRAILAEGKHALEAALGATVDLFAPPWNTYDAATLRALADLGFTCLSAGPRFGPADRKGTLRYLPATCLLTALEDVLAAARRLPDPEPTVVALFHPYDFVEVEPERGAASLAGLAETLDRVAGSGAEIVSMRSLIDAGEDLGPRRFVLHRALRRSRRLSPPAGKLYRQTPGVYLSTSAASRAWRSNVLALGSSYLAVFLAASALSTAAVAALLPAARSVVESVELLGPLLVAGVAAYALRRARLSYKGAVATVLAAGAYAGTLIAAGFFALG
jgi:hypothetical protein